MRLLVGSECQKVAVPSVSSFIQQWDTIMPVCIGPLIALTAIALLILFFVIIMQINQHKRRKEEQREKDKRAREEKRRIERERRQIEEERRLRKLREKYDRETPARRALICQLYHESIDLKEITFILRRAGYNGPTGKQITMKEIMEEHAQMQIEKHIESQVSKREEKDGGDNSELGPKN